MTAYILKHWREAATLMICAKRSTSAAKDAHGLTRMLTGVKTFEDSLGKLRKCDVTLKQSDYDYDFLYIERSNKSTFMPTLYAYPGGVAENEDFSHGWCGLFSKANCNPSDSMQKMHSKCQGLPAPMFSRERPAEFSYLSADIAFRISAIRETFEESGVLVVKSFDETAKAAKRFEELQINLASVLNLSQYELDEWRKKIAFNPAAFLELCDHLNVLPDIWSLYEWSNWLTPIYSNKNSFMEQKKGRRYDTAFYMCFADASGSLQPRHDRGEASTTELLNPLDVLHKISSDPMRFAPPQFYENSRLLTVPNFKDLANFAVERSKFRVARWTPYLSVYSDGVLLLLPGDELYPENADVCSDDEYVINQGRKPDLMSHPAANRLTFIDNSKFGRDFDYNVSTHGRHLAPVTKVTVVPSAAKLS